MKGVRKLILAIIFGGITAYFPLNESQAEVLIVLIVASMGANLGEHLAGGGVKRRILDEAANLRARVRRVSSVTDPEKDIPG